MRPARFASRFVVSFVGSLAAVALLASGCVVDSTPPSLAGQDVRLTIVHTADLHSRLFPYQFAPGAIDKGLGLVPTHGDIAIVGGIARMSTVIKCIRGSGGAICNTMLAGNKTLNDLVGGSTNRSIHLDSGDMFEGAPVFNTFAGEVEMRAMSRIGLNAMALGNHEFDKGAVNLELMKEKFGGFPILAANYQFSDPGDPTQPKLRLVIAPFAIFNVQGLRIGVIGMGNLSSLQGIIEGGNSLGVTPIETNQSVRNAVNILRGQVDLVVMISHLGLDEDEGVAQTSALKDQNPVIDGVDVTLGGHLHIVLNPPKDLPRTDENMCPTGHTVLCHSGAFAKFVGRLDLAVHVADPNKHTSACAAEPVSCQSDLDCRNTGKDPKWKDMAHQDPKYADCQCQLSQSACIAGTCQLADRNGVKSYTYKLIPIDDSIPEDADMANMLEPYQLKMNTVLNLTHNYAVVPCPPTATTCPKVPRNDADGGDSQLGNLVAASMRLRPRVEADFGLTNSLGIRADFESGPLNLEQMYNVFPFDNTITTMFLSGNEIQQMLDFVAARSSERGCKSQAQVSGIWVVGDCAATRTRLDSNTGMPVINPDTKTPYIDAFPISCGPIDAMGMPTQHCHPDQRELDGPYLLGDNCIVGNKLNPSAHCYPVLPSGEYRVAVNDYIAAGGSGFAVLKRNTTKFNTGISLRDALIDFLVEQPKRCNTTDYTNISGVTCRTASGEPVDCTAVCACRDKMGAVVPATDCKEYQTCLGHCACYDASNHALGADDCLKEKDSDKMSAQYLDYQNYLSCLASPPVSQQPAYYDYSSLPCLDNTVEAHDGRISMHGGK